jgi:DNA-binding CsgD family transcriptional regulator
LPGNHRLRESTPSDLAGVVFSFTNSIRDCKSLDACATLFRETIAQYGFDTFACGEVDLDERNRSVFYIVDWPKRFFDFYIASEYINRDPLIGEIERKKHAPFAWSELLRDKFLADTGRQMLRTFAELGWTEGMAVPFLRNDRRFGLVSLIGGRGPLAQHEKNGLSIMAMCLHEQARRIGPSLGVALALSALSLRELDALRLVARGHSDKRIGILLGIAQSTAQEHVEAAKRKLKVRNRAEAAAVCVSLGLA